MNQREEKVLKDFGKKLEKHYDFKICYKHLNIAI